ncbi:hypothetical protein RhiirA5_434638 [Rhizophagus irregularis]|uniref:Uncharacterized protein n=1 Tax=Rhizophagus irregularis TaxID=588596 RepID=A0A2N0NPS8_9GLOM|nr:hypothetical protein RhiirA5_434638 [Rhizophagus irregularis]
MSSKNDLEQRTPYVKRVNLSNIRTRSKPQKPCPDCKETNDCNKIEEVIDNFHENPIKQNKSSKYRKFVTVNNHCRYLAISKNIFNNLSQAHKHKFYGLRFIKKLFKIL